MLCLGLANIESRQDSRPPEKEPHVTPPIPPVDVADADDHAGVAAILSSPPAIPCVGLCL